MRNYLLSLETPLFIAFEGCYTVFISFGAIKIIPN